MSEAHDFDREVIAVLDEEPEVRDAVSALRSRGYDVEVLEGESGRTHLDPAGEKHGVMTMLKRLVEVFGDEQRILEQLDAELAQGRRVVSVEVDEENAGEVAQILKDHGGRYVWRFGAWTHQQVGD